MNYPIIALSEVVSKVEIAPVILLSRTFRCDRLDFTFAQSKRLGNAEA